MAVAVPFQITIPESRLRKLHAKLALYDPPTDLEVTDPWLRGCSPEAMQNLVSHWMHNFDWRAQEALLNKLPQFTCAVEVKDFGSYNIHFIHARSPTQGAIPLLYLHGWPGNFSEVSKILPLLTQGRPGAPRFHIIAPSLVGFGFSDSSKKEGFGIEQHAEAYHGLMQSLGYEQYAVQGGDIGYVIARFLAWMYPKSCVAHHTNMPSPHPPRDGPGELTADDVDRLEHAKNWQATSIAYAQLQAHQPQTIGYCLADSPVGLLAWIFEKLHAWTDNYNWTADEILTWVSIYYFSKAGPAAAQHIYFEMGHRQPPALDEAARYINVKLGISHFPKEIILLPTSWNKTLGPLVFERRHEKGGHFAAWECPNALATDLQDMFGTGGGACNCIEGASGF